MLYKANKYLIRHVNGREASQVFSEGNLGALRAAVIRFIEVAKRDFEELDKGSSELRRRLKIILEIPKFLGSTSDLFFLLTSGKKGSD